MPKAGNRELEMYKEAGVDESKSTIAITPLRLTTSSGVGELVW
jgi:hypothetical protein